MTSARPLRVVGRYLLADAIAAGGMATVYLARLLGEEGFSRTVALKQLHPHFSGDSDFVDMFFDEARMLSRIRHPNVVAPLDVVVQDGDLFIAMEYVHGETLFRLASQEDGPVASAIASAVMTQVLYGLHAAHEALGEGGQPMDIVHRDVSPQNILVGEDGGAKIVDFGIARALFRNHTTEVGLLKGKLGYISPEQLRFEAVDRRTDVYSAGIVLWELLTGQRLFPTETPAAAREQVLAGAVPRPSTIVPSLPAELDDLVMQSLAPQPKDRFQNARAMALALGQAASPASVLDVGAWVGRRVGPLLSSRAERIVELETVDPNDLTLVHAQKSARERVSTPGLAGGLDTPARSSVEHTGLSITPSTISRGPGRRQSRSLVLLPSLLAVVGGVLIFLTFRSSHTGDGKALAPARAPVAAAPAAGAVAGVAAASPGERTPSPSAAEPAAVATTATATSASVPAASPKAERASATKANGKGKGKEKPRAGAQGSAPSCDPPYSIDPDGIKHFKPECFK